MPSTIDLHIHSANSDGTDTPEELLNKINMAGIKIFTLTDHDTINGVRQLKNLGVKNFVAGIEFSCMSENKNQCHILGLGYDENNNDFKNALKAGEDLRHEKFFKRVKALNDKFKIKIYDSEIEELLKIPSVGKPHLGNLIVKKGFANSRVEAIENIIDKIKTGIDKISAELAIKSILSAGGVAVWAHPLAGERENFLTEEIFRKTLARLMNYGLNGLECYYSKYNFTQTKWLADVAKSEGLLISGGSDYHGSNKNIPLGRLNSDDEIIAPEFLTVLNKLKF